MLAHRFYASCFGGVVAGKNQYTFALNGFMIMVMLFFPTSMAIPLLMPTIAAFAAL